MRVSVAHDCPAGQFRSRVIHRPAYVLVELPVLHGRLHGSRTTAAVARAGTRHVTQQELRDVACAKGAPYADEALAAIRKNQWSYDRVRLQTTIGHLLGYRAGDIAEFLLSDVARTCPCDCCGGPDTVEPPVKHGEFDQNVRRTMYHA